MTLSRSILATLTYSDHFGFPLTLDELHSRLIGCSISRISLIRQIRLMLKHHALAQTGVYYHLPGRSHLVSRRKKRQQLSQSKLALAHRYCRLLSRAPGVSALYLTGSLAVGNADIGDDIDLMVITEPGVLWLTRLFLTFYTEFLGIRRRPASRANNNRLCLNLYLTPDSLTIPEHKRSLYTAYELIQALPLFDPADTHSALLSSNSWLLSYLPNSGTDPKRRLLDRRPGQRPSRDTEGGRSLLAVIRLLDSLAYHLQLSYMRGKMTTEYVTKSSAFFHPADPGRTILSNLTSIPDKLPS